ncbi:winged helix-turn-helix domain-containing protein [Candidatus Halobonum tyrrellensis]|uniref:Uncharacterized protein n=1 Tax=Candidatus Halobonum tyrrellensis G22 TaxID=1324957 RepID=V4HK09_9EURY|nr:winged helix-turn-helix domain-containing protein [Candidatus Halobonum tyrrellensis]ESP90118.1 hypothetical protein K933_01117 [Candidatus Halobonum tyrrellensis G22]
MLDNHWNADEEFEAGTAGDQHSVGASLSVGDAVLEELSGFGVFTEREIASRLHLDEATVLDRLRDLRSKGLVEGTAGAWTRDFEHGELPRPDDEYIF